MPAVSPALEKLPLRYFFPRRVDKRTALERLGNDAVGLASMLAHYLLRALPVDLCSVLGGQLWSLVGRYRFPEVNARIGETWSRLRPDAAGAARRDAIANGLWWHAGRVLAEFSVHDRMWRQGRLTVSGIDHLHAARAAGRPIIMMGTHLGNWETIAAAVIGEGHAYLGVYEPPLDRLGHRLVVASRNRLTVDSPRSGVLPPGRAGTRSIVRALQERRGVVGIFIDEWRDGRVNAPAFGRPMPTEGNIAYVARLAEMTGAAVIPGYCLRVDGARFRITFLPPVELVRSGDRAGDLAANIARFNGVMEPIVRAHLEQWLMLFDFRFEDR